MPFVKKRRPVHSDEQQLSLGRRSVHALIIMGEEEKLPVAGRVIWMTPKVRRVKRTVPACGVNSAIKNRGNTQKKIENYSPGAWAEISRRTH